MKTSIEFNKALRLLDCGKIERAVEILQTVINNAQNEGDDLRMNDSGLDEDLFDYEKSTALKILSKLNNNY